MAVTKQSLVNKAYRLAAGTGQDPHQAFTIDNVWVFEEAFPIALSRAIEEIGLSSAEIEHYRREHELTVTDGSADLPQDVLHRFLDSSTISSDDDDTVAGLSSFCNRYSEFLNPPHTALHYYTTLENTFRYREAGGLADAFDGTIKLQAVSVPATPAVITDTMTIPEDVADRLVEILANMVKGRSLSE